MGPSRHGQLLTQDADRLESRHQIVCEWLCSAGMAQIGAEWRVVDGIATAWSDAHRSGHQRVTLKSPKVVIPSSSIVNVPASSVSSVG